MIIDCDTHVIPRDAFDYVDEKVAGLRPVFHFDDKGHWWHCDFPGTPRGKRRVQERAKQVVPPEVSSEKNKLPPSQYFKNNFYFTIETEEPELPEAIEFLGAEHFLFATDYPHDDPGGRMKFKDVELLKINQEISDADKEKIRCENARELFKLA